MFLIGSSKMCSTNYFRETRECKEIVSHIISGKPETEQNCFTNYFRQTRKCKHLLHRLFQGHQNFFYFRETRKCKNMFHILFQGHQKVFLDHAPRRNCCSGNKCISDEVIFEIVPRIS